MDNMLMKKDLTAQELLVVQGEVAQKGKNKGTAYLLWFFTGGIGGHRYYLGDIGQGIAMTLTLGLFGFWTLIDLFFIGRRVDQINGEVERQAILTLKAMKQEG